MDILKEHIVTLEKDQLSAHQSELTAFFIKALDFRAEHSQVKHIRSFWSSTNVLIFKFQINLFLGQFQKLNSGQDCAHNPINIATNIYFDNTCFILGQFREGWQNRSSNYHVFNQHGYEAF